MRGSCAPPIPTRHCTIALLLTAFANSNAARRTLVCKWKKQYQSTDTCLPSGFTSVQNKPTESIFENKGGTARPDLYPSVEKV